MHARLSQMIYRAAKQCPHHPAYEETYSNTRDNVGKMGSCEEEGLIGMGNMSQMSMETLVFGGAILALVDSVVVALSMLALHWLQGKWVDSICRSYICGCQSSEGFLDWCR